MQLNDRYFLNPAHLELARARYFNKDDNGKPAEQDIDEVFCRTVNYIYQNDDEEHAEEALKFRREKKVIEAGRPLAQAGTKTKNMLNCFVIGFEDDTREAISELKRKHFNIQAQGGGTGINFSALRPSGSICKSTQSRSSGAVGFITDFSYQSSNISQGGNRSGANMGVLEDWHPDLYEVITKKSLSNGENIRKFSTIYNEDEFAYFQWAQPYQWQMFNVSVFVSDKLMKMVSKGGKDPWILSWNGKPWHLWEFRKTLGPATREKYNKTLIVTAENEEMARYKASTSIPFFNNEDLELIRGPFDLTANEWFGMICENAWRDGCPGVVFEGLARRYHNAEYFNPIEATNPCAEQFLPRNSVCCLTSLILPSFFVGGEFLWDEFGKAIYQTVRGLDNIITLNKTGEKDIDANSLNERRIGLGTTGVAELLLLMGLKYSSQKGRNFVSKVLEFFRDKAYEASIELAKERGAFPAYEFKGFSQSEFFKTLPEYIQNLIRRHGIRNVTILTQAPTGTTGTMVGFSTGCEPYFAMCFSRNSRVGSFLDGSPAFMVWLHDNGIDYANYGYSLSALREKVDVPDYFEEAHEISWMDHLKMQAIFSKYVDSSVSKTINLPNSATVEDVQNAYISAYKMGIKSTTVYRDGSKQQILEHVVKKSENKRPKDIIRAHAPKRPKELDCDIYHTSIGGEKWTVLVGLLDDRPYEIFCAPQDNFEIATKYKKGMLVKNGKGSYYLDTGDFKMKNISSYLKTDEHRVITRLLSTCLRHGVPMPFISDQLAKADGTVVDFSKAVLRVLKKYGDLASFLGKDHVCAACGSNNVVLNNGCPECLDCGVSKCG
jgi:ribonucleoside-diphosphate reductase alpha chain